MKRCFLEVNDGNTDDLTQDAKDDWQIHADEKKALAILDDLLIKAGFLGDEDIRFIVKAKLLVVAEGEDMESNAVVKQLLALLSSIQNLKQQVTSLLAQRASPTTIRNECQKWSTYIQKASPTSPTLESLLDVLVPVGYPDDCVNYALGFWKLLYWQSDGVPHVELHSQADIMLLKGFALYVLDKGWTDPMSQMLHNSCHYAKLLAEMIKLNAWTSGTDFAGDPIAHQDPTESQRALLQLLGIDYSGVNRSTTPYETLLRFQDDCKLNTVPVSNVSENQSDQNPIFNLELPKTALAALQRQGPNVQLVVQYLKPIAGLLPWTIMLPKILSTREEIELWSPESTASYQNLEEKKQELPKPTDLIFCRRSDPPAVNPFQAFPDDDDTETLNQCALIGRVYVALCAEKDSSGELQYSLAASNQQFWLLPKRIGFCELVDLLRGINTTTGEIPLAAALCDQAKPTLR